jgi:hypothetical protein
LHCWLKSTHMPWTLGEPEELRGGYLGSLYVLSEAILVHPLNAMYFHPSPLGIFDQEHYWWVWRAMIMPAEIHSISQLSICILFVRWCCTYLPCMDLRWGYLILRDVGIADGIAWGVYAALCTADGAKVAMKNALASNRMK